MLPIAVVILFSFNAPEGRFNYVWNEFTIDNWVDWNAVLGGVTRRLDAIMAEIEGFFAACRRERVWPGGVHIEFTGEDVTECLGGSEAVLEEQLSSRYMSLCDPRLNARQSLDLAFRVAELMRAG
jgi:3-deoxy-7-phosphoheptulonate synthase